MTPVHHWRCKPYDCVRETVKALFTRSDAVFDIEQIYDLAKEIG